MEAIHVRIKYPHFYRKELLNLAVDIIQLLKKFEELKAVKNEERKVFLQFKNIVREIKHLGGQLDIEKLPQIEAKAMPKKPKEKVEEKKKPEVKEIKLHKKTHLEHLDTELDVIRKKLERL